MVVVTNKLRTGVAWMESQLMTYAAEQVLYQDIDQGLVSGTGLVTATPGRTDLDVDDFDGVMVRSSSFDWIIKHADLVTYGLSMQDGSSQPKRGDYILWAVNSVDLTTAWTTLQSSPGNPVTSGTWKAYEVASMSGGSSGGGNMRPGGTFDFEDPYSKMLRVHTKYLGIVTASSAEAFP